MGGTIYDVASQEFGFIQGLDKATAIPTTPDIKVLNRVDSESKINIPTSMMNIFTASSV